MIPIRDINRSSRTPVVVYGIIIINVLVFLYQLGLSPEQLQDFFYQFGATPRRFLLAASGEPVKGIIPTPLTLLTHMFVHGGWLHIIGNMWFLFIFGDNIEDALGSLRFAVFYLLCGLGAAGSEMLLSSQADVPMIGASGAIAGVMGAYLWLFPRARVVTLIPIIFFFYFVEIPAMVFLAIWFGFQLLNANGTYVTGGGVAYYAHAGGFIVGLVLILTILKPSRDFVLRQTIRRRHTSSFFSRFQR